jgi:hypothetical protein
MSRKIEVLSIVETGLQRVNLPSLKRPPVPNDDPNEELVIWGIQYYSYSVVAHLRTVLRGLVVLIEAGNIPTAFIVCRHIFEWAAHTCYMSRNMKNYVERGDWKRAWHLHSLAMDGNRWIKDHGSKYSAPSFLDNPPDPLSVPNLVNCLEEYRRHTHGNADAKDSYGLLSEHSHPNASCFLPYCKYFGNEVRFVPSSPDTSRLGVEPPLIELMIFLDALLELGREKVVRAQVLGTYKELAGLASTLRSAEQS